MKVFRELRIEGEPEPIQKTIAAIDESLGGGWQRNAAAESRLEPLANSQMYCYSCSQAEGRPAAELWLCRDESGNLFVSNILPSSKRKLDYDEYNRIIKQFHDKFAQSAAKRAGTQVTLTSDRSSVENWVSADTARLLHTFSAGANKSMGASHPSDEERWYRFLVAAHREGSRLDPSTLRRWLEEEEGWPEELAYDLALKYEAARSVLEYYTRQA